MHPPGFRPLGGPFQNKFWPTSHTRLSEIEHLLGWDLAPGYRDFVSEFGLSTPINYMAVRRDDDHEPPTVDVVYGDFPASPYSLLAAAQFATGDKLEIIDSDQGKFFLCRDGTIFFERLGGPPSGVSEDTTIASSFSDFLDRLVEVDPDIE